MRLILMLLCTGMLTERVVAQSTGQGIRMNLAQCIDRALMISPDVEQATLAVERMEARLSEAKYAGIVPQLRWTNIFGPAPGVKGDPTEIKDLESDPSDIGIFFRTQLDVIQPLYTWGKIGHAKKAAQYGVEAGVAGVVKKKSELVLQVKKIYYGMTLAKALREVVIEGQENVQKARQRVNDLIEEDSDEVGQSDLFKIDVFEFEVKKNLARADKAIEMGKAAMLMTLNMDRNTDFDILYPQEETEPASLEALAVYVNRARAERADVKQLRAGVLVRRSLLKISKSDFYPQIALVGTMQYGIAPHRTKFDNPFLRDNFNFFRAGAFVTLRQNFSFGLTRAKYATQKAELADLLSKENQAMNAIALEVERTYLDVVEANGNVVNSDRAMRSAKSWMTSSGIGFDITGDSADLLNAFTAYSKMRNEYHQAVFSLKVALAGLDHVTGVDVPAVR